VRSQVEGKPYCVLVVTKLFVPSVLVVVTRSQIIRSDLRTSRLSLPPTCLDHPKHVSRFPETILLSTVDHPEYFLSLCGSTLHGALRVFLASRNGYLSISHSIKTIVHVVKFICRGIRIIRRICNSCCFG
jgi:hypothetical protein